MADRANNSTLLLDIGRDAHLSLRQVGGLRLRDSATSAQNPRSAWRRQLAKEPAVVAQIHLRAAYTR